MNTRKYHGEILPGLWGVTLLGFVMVVVLIGGWAAWMGWQPVRQVVPAYPRSVRAMIYAQQIEQSHRQLIQSFETKDTLETVISFYEDQLSSRRWSCIHWKDEDVEVLRCGRRTDAACAPGSTCDDELLSFIRRPCSVLCILIYAERGRSYYNPGLK